MIRRSSRMLYRALITIGATAALVLMGAGPAAGAPLTYEPGAFVVGGFNQDGTVNAQAGAHPDRFTTSFSFAPKPNGYVTEYFRNVHVELPPGAIGNPESVPSCSRLAFVELVQDPNAGDKCPVGSQVGVAVITDRTGGAAKQGFAPVFLLKAPVGSVSQLGMIIAAVPVTLNVGVETAGGYGLEVDSLDTSQGLPVSGVRVDIWGIPADPSHDVERTCGTAGNGVMPVETPCSDPEPPIPFFTNSTRCEAEVASVAVNGWHEPSYAVAQTAPPVNTGCDRISFRPTVAVSAGERAGSPSGLTMDISTPQGDDPETGLARGIMRSVRLALPKGMAISAASANELGACTDSQLGLGSNAPISCPDSSKLGSVTVTTPLLDHQLRGTVFLRSQASNDPRSGEMFRLAIVLEDKERGLLIKLPGQVQVDPVSGQVEAIFEGTPELSVSSIEVDLKSGPRAPLVSPPTCGTYEIGYTISSWSGQVVTGGAPFKVDQGCGPRGFDPSLAAGVVDPLGGAYSPFTFGLSQGDEQQNLSGLEVTLPKGELARLAGVPLCPDQLAVSGACPSASQVGQAIVGVGAGSTPVYVPQPGKSPTAVYLAGAYRGAPYSLVVGVPAQAGPFDLGTVAVRNALFLDPVTTQVTVKSDPLPQIVSGVPIQYRDVRVEVDRSRFTLNPTNCEPSEVAATARSSQGVSKSLSARFQLAGCEGLDLGPKLALKLSGAPPRRGGNPKLTATLTTGKNEANLRRVQVALPNTEFLENAHIKTVCTRVQYAADQCPAKSIYGYAKAWTPLLDKPLEGPVYLRSSNHTLPDLVASLDGQIHVDLAGRIDSVKQHIRNTFETVPDAPVTKFVLTMQGGGKGLLVNNTNLCKAKPKANVKFSGQNGKTSEASPLVSVAGCGKGGKKNQRK